MAKRTLGGHVYDVACVAALGGLMWAAALSIAAVAGPAPAVGSHEWKPPVLTAVAGDCSATGAVTASAASVAPPEKDPATGLSGSLLAAGTAGCADPQTPSAPAHTAPEAPATPHE